MSIEYISTEEQFNSRINTFELECKVKSDHSIYHVGLDCEYISKNTYENSFIESYKWTHKRTYNISICILQLASKTSCLIIDITKLGPNLPNKLLYILQSGNWIKTGVNINLDMTYLADNFNISFYNGCIDISTFASLTGFKNPSLKCLANFNKKDNISIRDWTQPLTIEMLEYCANDAFSSYSLGEKIINNITNTLELNINDKNKDIKIKINTINEKNYINLLQEYAQKKKFELPIYTFEQYNLEFTCTCKFLNKTYTSISNNKKQAKLLVSKNICDEYNIV